MSHTKFLSPRNHFLFTHTRPHLLHRTTPVKTLINPSKKKHHSNFSFHDMFIDISNKARGYAYEKHSKMLVSYSAIKTFFLSCRNETRRFLEHSVTLMEHPTDEEDGLEGCEDGHCPLQTEVPILPPNRTHGKLSYEEKRFLLSVERGDVATVRRWVTFYDYLFEWAIIFNVSLVRIVWHFNKTADRKIIFLKSDTLDWHKEKDDTSSGLRLFLFEKYCTEHTQI